MISFFSSNDYKELFKLFFDSLFYTNNKNQINEKFQYCIVNTDKSHGHIGFIRHMDNTQVEYFKTFINNNIADYNKIIDAYDFLCYFANKISIDIAKEGILCKELKNIEEKLISDLLIDKKNLPKESHTKFHSV